MLRRLILLAVLVAAGWWYWTRWLPTHNYKIISGRLEHAVGEALSESGITDAQVVRAVHQEHSRLGLVWIETDRRIEAPPEDFTKL